MKLIMFPLLFSLACIGFENRDKIMDQYNAAYPSDPAKQQALEQCIARNHNFNRMDADDRKHCYRASFGGDATIVALPPSPNPSYAYSPSHLAGNDIRRLEANAAYHPAGAASAPPFVPPQASVTAHRWLPLRHAAAGVRLHPATAWN